MAKKNEEKILDTVMETVDKVAGTVKETAEKIANDPQVKNATETAKKTAEKIANDPQVKNATAKAKKAAEKVTSTPEAKAATETAKKAAAKAKTTAAAASKAAKKEYTKLALKETYVQIFGQEIKESEILEKVEADWKANGHRVSAIKSLELYIKPEDGAAYYVINAKHTGSVEL